MNKRSKCRLLILLGMLVSIPASANSVYKCVDKVTGSATFSERPCDSVGEKKKLFNSSSGIERPRELDIPDVRESKGNQVTSPSSQAKSKPSLSATELCAKAQQDYKFEAARISNQKNAAAARANMEAACGYKSEGETIVVTSPPVITPPPPAVQSSRPCGYAQDTNCVKQFANRPY